VANDISDIPLERLATVAWNFLSLKYGRSPGMRVMGKRLFLGDLNQHIVIASAAAQL
jgi:hypothetical protein